MKSITSAHVLRIYSTEALDIIILTMSSKIDIISHTIRWILLCEKMASAMCYVTPWGGGGGSELKTHLFTQ